MPILLTCNNSEPSYGGVTTTGFNYSPFELSDFSVTDVHGHTAFGNGGGFACCYRLDGTEFTVKWNYYDADEWRDGKTLTLHAERKVTMPRTKVSSKSGDTTLQVHIFPDRHVELIISSKSFGDVKFDSAAVFGTLSRKYTFELANAYDEDDARLYRRVDRVIGEAWLKYHLEDVSDLEQYVYLRLLVNPHFDEDPNIANSLAVAQSAPGSLAKMVGALSPARLDELKQGRFQRVSVPTIDSSLLTAERPPTPSPIRLQPYTERDHIIQLFHQKHIGSFDSLLPKPSEMHPLFSMLIDKAHGYGIVRDDDLFTYVTYGITMQRDFDEYPDIHERLLRIKSGEQSASQALDIPRYMWIELDKWLKSKQTA